MAKFGKQPIIILVIIIILGIIIMITWDDEDVSILVSVVGTMPGCAVADGEPGSLVADQLQRYLVFGIQYLVFSICKERPTAKKETQKQKWGKPHNNQSCMFFSISNMHFDDHPGLCGCISLDLYILNGRAGNNVSGQMHRNSQIVPNGQKANGCN